MTRIFLIRHGETDWNKEEIFRGRKDIPLNKTGIYQAEKTALVFEKIPIDTIYTSPLDRSVQTAQAIHKYHDCIPLRRDDRLIDIDFGQWQGLSHKKVKNCFPELYNIWQAYPHKASFPGGETLSQVYKRVENLVGEINSCEHTKTVLLATHRVVCKVLTCYFLGLDLSRFWFIRHDTCAISLFEAHPLGFVTIKLNDTCHMEDTYKASIPSDF